jgi:hypothetical protein
MIPARKPRRYALSAFYVERRSADALADHPGSSPGTSVENLGGVRLGGAPGEMPVQH